MPPDFSDVSSYQAGADLGIYAHTGADRILIKATEGMTYTDVELAPWWPWAAALGLARGAYHFAHPATGNPRAEAAHFLAALNRVGGLGPRDWLCIDAESPTSPTLAHGACIAAIVTALVGAGHTSGVIYSGTWWLRPAGLTAAMLPPAWRHLHLSDYSTTPDGSIVLPPGWDRSQVVARQYTSGASQPGIPGASDRSRVLHEWLPTLGGLVLDDPTAQQIAGIVRAVLNEGTGQGQPAWAATERAILALEQTMYNGINAIIAALGWSKGDLSLAARSDAVASELGRMGDYLSAGGPLATWLTQTGQQLAALLAAVKALPTSTSGGADLTPVISRLDTLLDFVGSLTLTVAHPLNS